MGKYKSIGELLVFIGALIGLLFGILRLIDIGWVILWELPGVENWIRGILQIIVSLIILATSGKINIPALKLEKSGIILLILGIVLFIVGGALGAIIAIIGAILMLIK